MKTVKLLSWALLILGLFSCSDDSTGLAPPSGGITYYTTTSTLIYSNGSPTYRNIVKSNIVNGKFYSETFGQDTEQRYFYTGNLLTSNGGAYISTYYFYDGSNRPIATNSFDDTLQKFFQRFIYQDDNVVYVESLTRAYDDPQTEITARFILQFDNGGNVIQAGADADLNGVMDNVNEFTYVGNNLTSAHLFNGTNMSYAYSGITNNFSVLNDNTYGRKLSRLLYASTYASAQFTIVDIHSRNLLASELLQANYEIWNNGYYKKCSRVSQYPEGRENSVVEFYFN